jgi:hypothetical protein
MERSLIPFLVADRPISLSIIKGVGLPPNARIGIMGQATTTRLFQERFRGYPHDVDEIYLNGQPPDGSLKLQTVKMVDSGIFAKNGCTMTYDALFNTYEWMRAEYGVMLDVFKDRVETIRSAKGAMTKYGQRAWSFQLVGVAQGEQLDDYLRCYGHLLRLGFTHIAIGGLLKRRENTVRYVNVRDEQLLEEVLSAVRRRFNPEWLFVLGAFHPKRIPLFREYGVWGSDYKGWIFNYEKKDAVIDLIRSKKLQKAYRVARKDLRIRDVRKMTEQELRFFLTRHFVEVHVIKAIYGLGDIAAKIQ